MKDTNNMQSNTLTLSESEVNELRFMLANLESPSRAEAMSVVADWRTKLTAAMRQMHPSPVQTINAD